MPVYGLYGDWTEAGGALHDTLGTAEAEACSYNILGLVTLGDSSIATAMRDGGISKLHTIDHNYFRILGFYGKVCTRITGERGPMKEPEAPPAVNPPEE
jgi:hypothetical protein